MVAAVLSMIVCGMLGAGLEVGLFRPLRGRRLGIFQLVVVTIGLSLLGRQVIQLFFGAEPLPYSDFLVQERWEFGPWAVTPRELSTVVISIAALAGCGADAPEDPIRQGHSGGIGQRRSGRGVGHQREPGLCWSYGSWGPLWPGSAGSFQGLDTDIDPILGFQLLLLIFAGVELGGLGTAYGALAGSLIIGMSTEVSTLWISPELKFTVPLAALILVLLLRPQGLFGIKARVG